MSKTSAALRRFGVGVLSTAVIGTGFTAFATTASAATPDITGLTITPTSATTSTGENPCQIYTVDVEEANNATGSTLTVQLQPTGGIDSEFCSGPGAPLNPAGQGAKDSEDFVLAGNTLTFGVDDANASPTQGQIAIKVFPQNTTTPGTPASGAPVANATQNQLTAAAQNDVVTQLSVDPPTQTGTETDTVDYDVTATNGASSVVQDAEVYYSVKSSQGNSVGQDNVDCGATDNEGVVTCTVTVPTTSSVQSGPYTVTFKVPQNATGQSNPSSGLGAIPATNSGPTTTATLNSAPQPPAGTTVTLTCGDADTPKADTDDCRPPTSDSTVPVTATATTPATTAGGQPQPVSGISISFHFDADNFATAGTDADIQPDSCITDSSGQCTVNVVVTGTIVNGDNVNVHGGDFGFASSDNVDITWDNNFRGAAEVVSVAADSASAKTGSSDVITATVSNTLGAQSGSGWAVTFTVTGVGAFSNGSTQQTVTTGPNGEAQVALTSNAAGTSTVTAALDPAAAGVNCDTATGGACTDSTSVTWTKASTKPSKTRIFATIHCFSPKKHVLKCRVHETPEQAGLKVTFKRRIHGDVRKIGTDFTNHNGVAKLTKKHLKSGKLWRVFAHVYATSTTKGVNTDLDRTHIK